MFILKIVAIVYLTIGTLHAFYVAIKTNQPIIYLPINIIAGPVVLIFIIIRSLQGKRLPIDNPYV